MIWVRNNEEAASRTDYRQAVAEWVKCMAPKGYTVTDPLRPREGDDMYQFSRRDPMASPSVEEVAMALADIDCKEETELVPRLTQILKEVDQESIEKNQLALQEDRARIDERVRLATAEIEKAGGFQ